MNRLLLVLLLTITALAGSRAQCVTTFPYSEGFEANNGNWTTGGTNNDWVWGSPSKAVIAQPAGGSNCWITGGLTASFYNLGERSWVQSPCFDFTGLQHPYISFNIYWESEHVYDGTNLQSSTDGGVTWQNVGSATDPVNCMTQNWYNTSSINNLAGLATAKDGWSGNVQQTSGSCQGGGGSSGWKPAKHCLTNLAGAPNVIFRFTFGAGTACNDYDGIAFDDVFIGEAPTPVIDYTFNCQGNLLVDFNGTADICEDELQWNFGDPSSVNNTASGANVSHTFSSTGIYTVTLTGGGPCNPTTVISKNVEMIGVVADAADASCGGAADGMAYIVSQTSPNPLGVTWSTNPTQYTDTAYNLTAGQYTVTVSSTIGCPGIAQVIVSEPAPVTLTLATKPDTCFVGGGSINVTASTTAQPLVYTWSNGGSTNPLTGLNTGSYSVTVTDAASCSASATTMVGYTSGISISLADVTDVSCFETADGKITADVSGGATPYTYSWSNLQATPSVTNLAPAWYKLTVTDANGCVNVDSVKVGKEQCPSYIYFPTGFSPNGDGINDYFRPKYSIDLQTYEVRIYNRWGELVYASNDVMEGWDGVYKGIPQPLGTYVWVSSFSFMDGTKENQAGNLTLLR